MTPAPLPFVKMHGLGNDYVYIDGFAVSVPADPPALARRISDRHRGVGGDGLILVERSAVAAARMRMFNADGSESEMCGNGVRCVGHLVVSRGHAPAGPVRIETGRGVLDLVVDPTGRRSSRVRVDMGEPILGPAQIPVDHPGERVVDAPCSALPSPQPWWEIAGLDPRMTCVSMGNPHVVFWCRDVAAVPLEVFGARIETDPIFPARVNVHVVEVLAPDRVRMRTWERGSGITQACGTGASAVCVAGVLGGRTGERIRAGLPGGDLDLEWTPGGHVFMTGPAEEVFEGVWSEA
ncbi:MAG: diaminopimelate epimerase [Planctomycetia bacterium]